MPDSTITSLESALSDIEADILTTEAAIEANETQLSSLQETNQALQSDLTKYKTIRDDLIAAIDNLTVDAEDPEHPEEEDPDPEDADIDEDDYDDFEYA